MKEKNIDRFLVNWKVIENNPTKTLYLLSTLAKEAGLKVSIKPIDKEKKFAWVGVSPELFSSFEKLSDDNGIIALIDAESGNSLGRPRNLTDFGWDSDFRVQVEADWWFARGMEKRGNKILAGRERLPLEKKKEAIKNRLINFLSSQTSRNVKNKV